jgi:hypothetical protein
MKKLLLLISFIASVCFFPQSINAQSQDYIRKKTKITGTFYIDSRFVPQQYRYKLYQTKKILVSKSVKTGVLCNDGSFKNSVIDTACDSNQGINNWITTPPKYKVVRYPIKEIKLSYWVVHYYSPNPLYGSRKKQYYYISGDWISYGYADCPYQKNILHIVFDIPLKDKCKDYDYKNFLTLFESE